MVGENESNESVIRRLKEEGAIRSATIFNLVLKSSGDDTQFQPGIYDLTGADNYRDIIVRLASGGLAVEETRLGSLVIVAEEPVGVHCPFGGNRVDSGVDTNENGLLDPDEVRLTNYVCHGSDGAMDMPGTPGTQSLVHLSVEPVGEHCADGGNKVDIGIDTNNNRMLDPSEVTATSYVCHGAIGETGTIGPEGTTGAKGESGAKGETGAVGETGAEGTTGAMGAEGEAGTTGAKGETGAEGTTGATGATGTTGAQGTAGTTGTTGATGSTGSAGATSLVTISNEPAGANCTNAGKMIESGLDTNDNGGLDPSEVTATSYVCNGATGATGTTGATGSTGAEGETGATGTEGATSLVTISNEPAGANCPNAGKKMESGLDTNDNGVLDPSEVTSISYVCNGATGATGEAGATGATGAAGPAGSTLVTGATVTSASGASKGTKVTATATCPSGKVLLGGGARVTTTDPNTAPRAVLISSHPSSTTTWTAVGIVADSNLGGSETLSVTAYALCSL